MLVILHLVSAIGGGFYKNGSNAKEQAGGINSIGGNININRDSTTHGGFGGVIWESDGSVIAGYGGGSSFSRTPMTDNGVNVANHGRVTITLQK